MRNIYIYILCARTKIVYTQICLSVLKLSMYQSQNTMMLIVFICYTRLCLKAKHVTCLKSVTGGRLGTTHFRFTVLIFR